MGALAAEVLSRPSSSGRSASPGLPRPVSVQVRAGRLGWLAGAAASSVGPWGLPCPCLRACLATETGVAPITGAEAAHRPALLPERALAVWGGETRWCPPAAP